MSDSNIVQFRNGAPSLEDIPNMLRKIADGIEAKEFGEVDCVFLIMPTEADYPKVFGWGDVEGSNQPIIQLALASAWLVNNLVSR